MTIPDPLAVGQQHGRSRRGRRLSVALVGHSRGVGALFMRKTATVQLEPAGPLSGSLAARLDLLILASMRPIADLRRLLRATGPDVPVLIISPHVSSASVRQAFASGATGYLVEGEYTLSELEAAIGRIAAGQYVVSPSATNALVREKPPNPGDIPLNPEEELTLREQQLLKLIAAGATNRHIANTLHLTERTVRNYASRLYAKLNVRTRAEAIVWALTGGPNEVKPASDPLAADVSDR